MDYDEPTQYDESKATTSQRTRGPILHIEYLKSRAGILKIIEIVCFLNILFMKLCYVVNDVYILLYIINLVCSLFKYHFSFG